MGQNDTAKKHPKTNLSPTNLSGLSLGSLFKKRRDELKLSLDDIEKVTKIRESYLRLVEAGNYTDLADDVYSRGYVKNYAEYMGFDTKQILKLYNQERHSFDRTRLPEKHKNPMSLLPIDSQTYSVTPRTFLIILTLFFSLALIGYVGWQFSQLSAAPRITINNHDQASVNTGSFIVSGEVDGGSDVFINDSPILSAPDGSFSDRVALVDGVNLIKISAKNKFGKESTKVITVNAKLAKNESGLSNSVSNHIIDGVELEIKITQQATWIVVQVDGRDAFRGTMLPGSQQVFKAKTSISLTTGNAGSTQVLITNSIVTQKDLGTVGKSGEAKQNLVFNKDTEIQ